MKKMSMSASCIFKDTPHALHFLCKIRICYALSLQNYIYFRHLTFEQALSSALIKARFQNIALLRELFVTLERDSIVAVFRNVLLVNSSKQSNFFHSQLSIERPQISSFFLTFPWVLQ